MQENSTKILKCYRKQLDQIKGHSPAIEWPFQEATLTHQGENVYLFTFNDTPTDNPDFLLVEFDGYIIGSLINGDVKSAISRAQTGNRGPRTVRQRGRTMTFL